MRHGTLLRKPTFTSFIMFAQVRGTHSFVIGLGRPDKLSALSILEVLQQSDLRAKLTLSPCDQLVDTVEDLRDSPAHRENQ